MKYLFLEPGVVDDKSIGWLDAMFDSLSDELGRLWLRTRTQSIEEQPSSPNSSKIDALAKSILETNKNIVEMKKKTIELFDRLSDDQKSTAAALGRVANLLERVLPDRTTSASDQVPEANRSGNTGPTVKSIEVIVGPPGSD